MKLLNLFNIPKLIKRFLAWRRRLRQARQKTQCTAISLLLDKPGFDICSVCTNQFCICKIDDHKTTEQEKSAESTSTESD